MFIAVFLLLATPLKPADATFSDLRESEVIAIAGATIPAWVGAPIAAIDAYRCSSPTVPCTRIALQVDERDAYFRWALDQGPAPIEDDTPGVLDENDLLLLRAADAGRSATTRGLPAHRRHQTLAIRDPLDGTTGYIHLIIADAPPPRRLRPHVRYDAERDRASGRHVTLGFTDGIPQSLVVERRGGPSELLDRIKIRAQASLLWGLLRFTRSEADLTTEIVGWRSGPLRVIRHQQQRVRLGWGIRSPHFSSYTLFYPDFAELPVSLRLNHPPAALFGGVRIDVALDFIDLRGWDLMLPGRAPLRIGAVTPQDLAALDTLETDWFALRHEELMLLQVLETSDSLRTTRRRLIYRESARPNPPESSPGEWPAVGYRIERWDEVDAGTHHLRALCFALPPTTDVEAFLETRQHPLVVTPLPLPQPDP